MLSIAQSKDVAGNYVGTSKIRPGMEAALAPIERKRIAKGEAAIALELKGDGTFLHKKTTFGVYQIKGDRIFLKPNAFNGTSLDSMKSAAEQAGRAFGLAWLFEPFELVIKEDALESAAQQSLIYVEYVRKA